MNNRFVGGRDGKVFFVTKHSVVKVGEFEWGCQSQSAADLAKEILWRTLNSQVKATNLYRRFLHRKVATITKGTAWTLTVNDVQEIVQQIESVATEMARVVPRVGTPPPPPPSVGGALPLDPRQSGYGGNDNAPDRKRGR